MGVSDFLGSPVGKRITGTAYGFGASVVIVGALFKIQHWPGAGAMLCAGMFTEAILFALSALEKPHKDWKWSLVYPELEGGDEKEKAPKKSKKLVPEIVDPASLVEAEVMKLSEGIKRLNETAGQLGAVSSAAVVTDTYVNNLAKASDAAGSFAVAQRTLKDSSDSLIASYEEISASIGLASKGSQNFASQIEGVNQNISTINSVFELQVKSVNEQNEALKSLTESVNKIEGSLSSSALEAEEYKQQIVVLAQQLKSLNSVYGNMLNALTIRG